MDRHVVLKIPRLLGYSDGVDNLFRDVVTADYSEHRFTVD